MEIKKVNEDRIQHVVLIDDNKTTNFLNKYLMLKSKRFVKIEEFQQAEKVLYLLESEPSFMPDFIFVDLEMPTMNGWEFIDRFEQIATQKKLSSKLFILTSTHHEWETDTTPRHLQEFLIKPLSAELIDSLYYKYFDVNYDL